MTLPLHRHVHAEFRADPAGRWTVTPADRSKALRAARLTAGDDLPGGHLVLRGDIPVGAGMGSSTSDTVAAIRAVAAYRGTTLTPEVVAELAVRAEDACDPVMFGPRPRLFAHRDAVTLEAFAPLPPMRVLGCVTGGGAPVDTLALPEPAAADIPAFEELRGRLRRALVAADVADVGRVCTTGARLNQSILPKPELPTLEGIADDTGAAGVQVAHSGNVAGLIFGARLPDVADRLRAATRLLERHGIPVTAEFRPAHDDPRPGAETPDRGSCLLGARRR
ncbi:hypothetical protein BJF85_21185 [Saccharomonospora sp. CUA-673]|nr:hypothetical protein BJF85_21185 [Saccharomonospora sp. CUA-673]